MRLLFSPARLNRYKNACGGDTRMVYAQANYKQIIKYLAFLGYTEKGILYGYDVQTQELMNKILSL